MCQDEEKNRKVEEAAELLASILVQAIVAKTEKDRGGNLSINKII